MGTTRSAINMTVSGSLPVDSAEKGLILSPLGFSSSPPSLLARKSHKSTDRSAPLTDLRPVRLWN